MRSSLLSQMRALRPLEPSGLPEPSLEVSLLIPAKRSAHALEATVSEAHRYLSQAHPDGFEIILIPNPSPDDSSEEVARRLAERFDRVRVVPHLSPTGKGAGLRTGFVSSLGKLIYFTDADLPYDLDFFTEAASRLRGGFDFITGNRRIPTSHFNVPVSLLPLAYGRHRLGLAFNRAVRWLLPVRTTDTQAGIKAMTRRMAREAFNAQACPGFFFDLEFFLTARGRGYQHAELPVTLYLNTEKSTVRVFRESILAGFWLARIALRFRLGRYGRAGGKARVLWRFHSAPLGARFFLEARWRLTPYEAMASHLPGRGRILDLGCGHGLLSLALALGSPERSVLGIDHDEERVRLAGEAACDVPNLKFEKGSMLGERQGGYAGIAMIDVMHYFGEADQREIARQAFRLVMPGGTVIVREVDPSAGMVSSWNRAYEKLATATGFTRSERGKNLRFRSPRGWTELFREAGFRVRAERCSHFLFADVLFICERPE